MDSRAGRQLDAVLRERLPSFKDVSRDQTNITRDDLWKTFFLYGYGYRIDANCARCPHSARLASNIPGMFTAFFSILAPGKHILRHCSPYRGLLRGHRALMVPEPAERCRIEVGCQTRRWQEGKCLVFDDTYQHQVWNDTDGTRVVLFRDARRPLAWPASLLNRIVLRLIRWSPFIQDARRNHRAWERGFYR